MVNTLRQQTQAAGGQLLDEAEDLYDIFLAVNNFDGPDTGYIITIVYDLMWSSLSVLISDS